MSRQVPTYSAQQYYVQGVLTPPSVCRALTKLLRADIERLRREGIRPNPEFAAWYEAALSAANGGRTEADFSQNASAEAGSAPWDEQLTAKEAAAKLGCSTPNVWDLIRRGRLSPARRNPLLIDLAEVERYRQERDSQ